MIIVAINVLQIILIITYVSIDDNKKQRYVFGSNLFIQSMITVSISIANIVFLCYAGSQVNLILKIHR